MSLKWKRVLSINKICLILTLVYFTSNIQLYLPLNFLSNIKLILQNNKFNETLLIPNNQIQLRIEISFIAVNIKINFKILIKKELMIILFLVWCSKYSVDFGSRIIQDQIKYVS